VKLSLVSNNKFTIIICLTTGIATPVPNARKYRQKNYNTLIQIAIKFKNNMTQKDFQSPNPKQKNN